MDRLYLKQVFLENRNFNLSIYANTQSWQEGQATKSITLNQYDKKTLFIYYYISNKVHILAFDSAYNQKTTKLIYQFSEYAPHDHDRVRSQLNKERFALLEIKMKYFYT